MQPDLVNRRVDYRFAGHSLSLDLSLGLFSSAGVDAGSMLLLKSIAQNYKLDKARRILDVGCGVGTVGLALAARCPEAAVTLVDRDMLAVSFSRHNADLNRLSKVKVQHRLMTEGPHEGNYDLIVSNFPAKAGDPVLADYLIRSGELLSPGATAAIVIVHTLADRCRDLIEAAQLRILNEESSKQHTVFLYGIREDRKRKPSELPASNTQRELLSPYIRYSGEFRVKKTKYRLQTAWNISDFDTLSWRIKLLGNMLDEQSRRGTMVFWSPGQGHFPAICCRRFGSKPDRVILGGRDRLALMISRYNLEQEGIDAPIETYPSTESGDLPTELAGVGADLFLTDLDPIPRSDWASRLKAFAADIVVSGGDWAIVGRSADLSELTKNSKGWTPVSDKRHHGWRALILRRN